MIFLHHLSPLNNDNRTRTLYVLCFPSASYLQQVNSLSDVHTLQHLHLRRRSSGDEVQQVLQEEQKIHETETF